MEGTIDPVETEDLSCEGEKLILWNKENNPWGEELTLKREGPKVRGSQVSLSLEFTDLRIKVKILLL